MSQKQNATRKEPVITKFPYFLKVKHSANSERGTNLTNPLYDPKKKPVIKIRSKRSSSKGGKSKKVLKKKRNKTKKRKYKK